MSCEDGLKRTVEKQLSNFFEVEVEDQERIGRSMSIAYHRSLNCFQKINSKYYSSFRTTHSGQYATFLYYLSNEIFLQEKINETSDKIYYLNKIMHSFDLYYEVKMPDIFVWEHPVGTVLGKASYSNYFTVYQNCTVGGSWDKNGIVQYPEIGENVTLYSYASILGKCKIGKNSIISSHAYLLNQDVPDNSIVFGQGKEVVIKPNNKTRSIFK